MAGSHFCKQSAVLTSQQNSHHQLYLKHSPSIKMWAIAGNRAENTSGFSASSDYVRDQLIAAGYTVTIEFFDATSNLIAELPGDDSRLVIAGAHLDSVAGGPGNQDNGSGTAAK